MSERPGKPPRRLGAFVRDLARETAPKTTLARIQLAWEAAAGPEFASRCEPVAEREGVVTVSCESAVWAAELDLRQVEVLERLRRQEGLEQLRSLRAQSAGRGARK